MSRLYSKENFKQECLLINSNATDNSLQFPGYSDEGGMNFYLVIRYLKEAIPLRFLF